LEGEYVKRIVVVIIGTFGGVVGFAIPAFAQSGWQGNNSPTYETTYCSSDGPGCVATYWYLTGTADLSAVSGGYKNLQTSYEGLQEYWNTDPAAPLVQGEYTDAYNGSSFIDEYGATQSGCRPSLYPGGWALTPCAYSNYNSNGYTFSTPRLDMCVTVGSSDGWDYAGGVADACYYYINY
jgi:hypothetical protein